VIRLALRVEREQAELVLAELLDFAPGGVEEVELDGAVEYAIYGAPGELPELPALRAAVGGALIDVTTSEVADDWEVRWRRFHEPVTIDGRLHVRPPWAPAPPAGVIDVTIDPGRAFGTGAHPTTRLCLERMLALEPRGAFVDVGCGSGVLAIAAAKLGWEPVRASDYDEACIAATRENAARNGVEVEAERCDLRTTPPTPAPTLAANLLRSLLLDLAASLPDPLPRHLIASGLLAEEADGVAGAFARRGLALADRRDHGGWSALVLSPR
jgi:ribosomal protein L11 methyltransferase